MVYSMLWPTIILNSKRLLISVNHQFITSSSLFNCFNNLVFNSSVLLLFLFQLLTFSFSLDFCSFSQFLIAIPHRKQSFLIPKPLVDELVHRPRFFFSIWFAALLLTIALASTTQSSPFSLLDLLLPFAPFSSITQNSSFARTTSLQITQVSRN